MDIWEYFRQNQERKQCIKTIPKMLTDAQYSGSKTDLWYVWPSYPRTDRRIYGLTVQSTRTERKIITFSVTGRTLDRIQSIGD